MILLTTLSASTRSPSPPLSGRAMRTSCACPSSPCMYATRSVCVPSDPRRVASLSPGARSLPSTAHTTSPSRSPAFSAAPPGVRPITAFRRSTLQPMPAAPLTRRTVCICSAAGGPSASSSSPPNAALPPSAPVWKNMFSAPPPIIPPMPPIMPGPPSSPKNFLKISRGSMPPAPNGLPPPPPPPCLSASSPPWSYTCRFSASDSTVYASAIDLNLASASSLLSGFLSGCHLRLSLRKAFLISRSFAVRLTPRIL
mmetsp:Transcript_37129/g.94174  ORF Transcript_37129/g.94174 Transcript_37129/m.94174 type:complete len:255 (-) Transcript_37129:196-960(-)